MIERNRSTFKKTKLSTDDKPNGPLAFLFYLASHFCEKILYIFLYNIIHVTIGNCEIYDFNLGNNLHCITELSNTCVCDQFLSHHVMRLHV